MFNNTVGVVAFAFGVPSSITANRTIGRIASETAYRLGAAIYTQEDIPIRDDLTVGRCPDTPQGPPPTLRIARGAVQWAAKRKLQRLYVVAATPHRHRCLRDLEWAIQEAGASIVVCCCRDTDRQPNRVWFNRDSAQPRTKSRFAWYRREWVVRCMPMFLYCRFAA